MNIFLWVLQIVLALMFAAAGVMKATQPKDKLAGQLAWVEDYSANTVRLIGVSELLGALGLILPAATHIAPILTPIAATALAVVMALAINTHRRRHEASGMVIAAVLLVLTVIVAWGRFGPYAI
jgi:uncharacterized membrane protein YphA (DoxX/SURF4 family)